MNMKLNILKTEKIVTPAFFKFIDAVIDSKNHSPKNLSSLSDKEWLLRRLNEEYADLYKRLLILIKDIYDSLFYTLRFNVNIIFNQRCSDKPSVLLSLHFFCATILLVAQETLKSCFELEKQSFVM